jgi:hypothetical protein
MRRTSVFCLVFVIGEIFGPFINCFDGDTSPQPVPLSGDPHFRLLLENNHVRVWALELRPNEKTKLVSRGHDFLQVPLNEGWLSVLIEGRQPVPLWAEKKVRFVRGGFSQTLQNGEPETLRLVEVEFIQNVGVERCGPEAQVSCNCSGYSGGIVRINSCGVLETDDFAINQLENHGERLGLSIVPTLVVAIDPVRIQPFTAAEHAGLLLEPGQPVWVEKAGQSIQSGDHSIAKAVTIEFKKPSPGR